MLGLVDEIAVLNGVRFADPGCYRLIPVAKLLAGSRRPSRGDMHPLSGVATRPSNSGVRVSFQASSCRLRDARGQLGNIGGAMRPGHETDHCSCDGFLEHKINRRSEKFRFIASQHPHESAAINASRGLNFVAPRAPLRAKQANGKNTGDICYHLHTYIVHVVREYTKRSSPLQALACVQHIYVAGYRKTLTDEV